MEKTPRSAFFKHQEEYCEEKQYSRQRQNQAVHERTAYEQSLLSENDIWSIDGSVFIDKPLNKREDNYNKMSEREMFGQINQNPFLVQNNYLDDLMNQEKFLKPISTTSEKEGENNVNSN